MGGKFSRILTFAIITLLLVAPTYAQDDEILDFLPAILNVAKQPPPEPPPEGVSILPTHTFYVDSIDYLHIIGEIYNNTPDYIEFVKAYVNIFNGEQLVDTDFTYTTISTVSPYEKVCFDILLPNPVNWTSYTFEAPQFSTADVAPPKLTPYSHSGSYNVTYGWYEIIGLVRNDAERYVEYVKPVATLYDRSGNARECDYTYVNSTHLESGQSSAFEMTATGRDYSDIRTYRVQVTGR